jgi:Fur family transcriptional regulator, peroxide stress response regulator
MDHPTDPGTESESALRATLEASGWRLTRQRVAVYDQLQRADHHPTAEDVYQKVKAIIPSISLATVYKALDALVVSGLATRLMATNGSARYDARGDHHYHLRCVRTGIVEDVPTTFDPDLIAKLDPGLGPKLADLGFHVTGYRLELVGFYEDEASIKRADGDPNS